MDQDQDNSDMNVQSGSTLLRVIAGLQRGAEMQLQPGVYLIGCGDDCDIVLTDDLVAEIHFALELSESELKLEARNGIIAVGDVLLRPGEASTADTPVVISLGQSGLGIGAPGTDWNTLPMPDLAAAIAAAEAAESNEDELNQEQTEDDGLASGDEFTQETDPQEETAQQTEDVAVEVTEGADAEGDEGNTDDAATPVMGTLQRLEGQWRAAAAGALILVIGSTTAFFMLGAGGTDTVQVAETANASSYEAIRARFTDAGIREVDLKRDHRGAYRLSGYVADDEARKAMHAIFHEAQLFFHDHVRQINDIMRTVEISLENYKWPSADFGQHLLTSYVGGGVFEIDGYLGPEVDRTDLNRQIVTDAPGVVRLDFSRARLADWQGELEVELKRAGLKPWIQTSIVDGGIRVTGEVTPKEAEIWRKVGQEFVDKTRGWPKLTIAVREAAPHRIGTSGVSPRTMTVEAPPPSPRITRPSGFNIIGVIMPTDGPGRILLDNGSSRAEGESIADGAVLQSVSLNKVIIRKGDKNVEYRVGEEG